MIDLNRPHFGDALTVLQSWPDRFVQCCVTSPPYWGLRDYQAGAEELGKEKTPEEYVARMVAIFREVRRVLRDDGVLFLNLGDSYSGGKTGRADDGAADPTSTLGPKRSGLPNNSGAGPIAQRPPPPGIEPKNLVGIPWMVAFALRADGWYLRSDIIWHKPNPMPESVTDRPTKAHEYVFLMSKSARYYWDAGAVKEDALWIDPETKLPIDAYGRPVRGKKYGNPLPDKRDSPGGIPVSLGANNTDGKRNARTVWTIATEPYSGSHFAVMPPKLAQRCILAGSRIGDTVLDPFIGSGTVGMVAQRTVRNWIGIDLNPANEPLIAERTAQLGLLREIK